MRLRVYIDTSVIGGCLDEEFAEESKALLVSWNFKHIVHVEKIRGFNSVNLREGYPTIDIRSPKEVV
jgi:hypothetical protein